MDKKIIKRTTFTLTDEIDNLLRDIAEKSGLKMSMIVNQAVKAYAKKFYEKESGGVI